MKPDKLLTLTRLLREFKIDSKNQTVLESIFKEAHSLAMRAKQINQINPTYFDIITTLVHINENYFKTYKELNITTAQEIIDIINPNEKLSSDLSTFSIKPNIINQLNVFKAPPVNVSATRHSGGCGCG